MKKSLTSWLARHWRQQSPATKRRLKRASACLAVGLATAWAAPAEATVVHLEVTPTETMSHAFVAYYTKNTSSNQFFLLGTLLGGQTTTFHHDLPFTTLDDFDHTTGGGLREPGYLLFGAHGTPEDAGIGVSFPDDSPILDGLVWEDISSKTQQEVIGLLQTDDISEVDNLRIGRATHFGAEATIVNFSEATFGGTALAYVPEPATWVLLVTGAGVVALTARRRST